MKMSSNGSAVRDPAPASVNGALSSGGVPVAGVPAARLPLGTRQRRPGYVALGVLLIVGLAALGGYFYTSAGEKTPVVVVVQQVPAGHVVTAQDLSTVDVAGGVVAIAAGNMSSVLGQTATVDLLPNMLLQRSMVTSEPVLGVNEAQVGLALRAGQLPSDGVAPGDTVQVLQLPAKDSTGSAATAAVLVASAAVFSAHPDPSVAGGWVVTVTVPTSAAAAVATASGLGAVALVMVRS